MSCNDDFNTGKPDFDHFPRGSFEELATYLFKNNSCGDGEVRAILDEMDTYFQTTNPKHDLVVDFTGPYMGHPDSATVTHVTNIQAKFQAQTPKRTFTISMNSVV